DWTPPPPRPSRFARPAPIASEEANDDQANRRSGPAGSRPGRARDGLRRHGGVVPVGLSLLPLPGLLGRPGATPAARRSARGAERFLCCTPTGSPRRRALDEAKRGAERAASGSRLA